MTVQVVVAAGVSNAVLPGNLLVQGGQTLVLSDEQYALITPTAGAALFSSVSEVVEPGEVPAEAQPTDHGLISWSFDPVATTATWFPTAGTVYLSAVYIRQTTSVSRIWFGVNEPGSGAVSGASNVGLYAASGTLLGSANVDAQITSRGPQYGSLAAPAAVPPGAYWVGLQVSASTAPGLAMAGGSFGLMTLNQAPASYRFAVNGSGTSLPSSIVPASNSTTGAAALWVAVS